LVTGWVEVDIEDTIANSPSPDLSKPLVENAFSLELALIRNSMTSIAMREDANVRTTFQTYKKHIGLSGIQAWWEDTGETVNDHSAATAAELNHSPKYTQSFALTGPLSSQNSKLGQAVHGACDHPETPRSGLIARYT
jgi:hypothetical protein